MNHWVSPMRTLIFPSLAWDSRHVKSVREFIDWISRVLFSKQSREIAREAKSYSVTIRYSNFQCKDPLFRKRVGRKTQTSINNKLTRSLLTWNCSRVFSWGVPLTSSLRWLVLEKANRIGRTLRVISVFGNSVGVQFGMCAAAQVQASLLSTCENTSWHKSPCRWDQNPSPFASPLGRPKHHLPSCWQPAMDHVRAMIDVTSVPRAFAQTRRLCFFPFHFPLSTLSKNRNEPKRQVDLWAIRWDPLGVVREK